MHIYVRSIPACAGEPVTYIVPIPSPKVYPRVCGDRMDSRRAQLQAGSIPACAGGTGSLVGWRSGH